MLADLAEVGMRAVANVTRTASSQAIGRSKVVMSAEWHESSIGHPYGMLRKTNFARLLARRPDAPGIPASMSASVAFKA